MGANANVLDSFFVALGFQVDTEGIEKFQSKFDALKGAALRFGAVAAGAAVGIGLMVDKVVERLGGIQHFAELNNLSAKEVAAFNRVAEDNLITSESMESSIQSLNMKIGEAAKGYGRGRMIFEKFGLTAKDVNGHTKSFGQVLGDVALKMQHMSRQENIALATKLGLDPKLVLLLEKGSDNLRRLVREAEEANPLTNEQYQQAIDVEIAFIRARRTLTLFTTQIAASLIPVVKDALEKYLAWFKAMRADTASTFNRVLKVTVATVKDLWNWLSRAIDALTKAAHWIGEFKIAAWAARAAVAALVAYKVGVWASGAAQAIVMLTKAIVGMTSATAGLQAVINGGILLVLALIIDDLWNWYHGNESLIGQLETKYPNALEKISAGLLILSGIFVAVKWTAITSMLETMAIVGMYAAEWITAHIGMGIAAWTALAPILAIIAAVVLVVAAIYLLWKNWDDIYRYIAGTWEMLKEKVDEYIQKVKDAWQKVKGFFGFGDKNSPTATVIQQSYGATGSNGASGGFAPTAGRSWGAPSSSHQSTVNSQTVNIPGGITVVSPDPAKAGQAIQDTIRPGNTRTLIRNGQSGVGL